PGHVLRRLYDPHGHQGLVLAVSAAPPRGAAQSVMALTSDATPRAPDGAMSSTTTRAPGRRSRRAASSVAASASAPAGTVRSLASTPQARRRRRVVAGTRL